MHRHYFERLHAEEARRAEWAMLDTALAERNADIKLHPLRVAVGHWMIVMGARLAGESVSAQSRPTPERQ
jgi:hypothetical protein